MKTTRERLFEGFANGYEPQNRSEELAHQRYLAESGETPPKSAPKAEWIEHAEAVGADPEEVEDMTKAEIIEEFGSE
jgi:hypothetical protein